MLGHINNSGQHLLNLINEILDISRIESGRVIVTLRAVSLDDLIPDCVGIITLQANQRGLTVEVGDITDALVRADEQRLRQVLLNLLSNAIKYNRPQGHVIVSTEIVDDVVRDLGARHRTRHQSRDGRATLHPLRPAQRRIDRASKEPAWDWPCRRT